MYMRMTLDFGRIALGLAIASLPFQWNKVLAQNSYFQRNVVSDIAGMAEKTDTNLVNPWGIATSASSPFWVGDNQAGVSIPVHDFRPDLREYSHGSNSRGEIRGQVVPHNQR